MENTRLDRLARAHDVHAPGYDAALEQNPVAVWMRARLWAHYARVFPAHARILDFTAGTGTDALFLAERGAKVIALDISPGMIDELQCHADARGLAIPKRILPAERLAELNEFGFDGAISGFAGLNTIEDLPRLAHDLAVRLVPRGRVILHILNATCLWEQVNQILHGQRPRERTRETQIGNELVSHHFYRPLNLYRMAFASQFKLREVYGLSVVAAPPLVRKFPTLAAPLFRLDQVLGQRFVGAGDFFVIDLEKR